MSLGQEKNTQVGDRLREVREKLELSQSSAAKLVGVTREQWGRYERGITMPGGEVLAALARADVDVSYVLTGSRRGPFAPPLNAELLGQCVQAVDAAINKRKLPLAAEHRGRLYKALYEFSLPAGKVNEQTIGPLLDLAAP